MTADLLAMRITDDFAAAAVLNGKTHSTFAAAVNLAFPVTAGVERLITLLPPRFSGIPDSLVLPEAAFSCLAAAPADTAVRKQGLVFSFPVLELTLDGRCASRYSSELAESAGAVHSLPAGNPDIRRLVQFQRALDAFRQSGALTDGFTLAPPGTADRIRQVLFRFTRFWLLGDADAAMAELPQCLGWGHGLTPSADDTLVGILALAAGARKYAGWPPPCGSLQLEMSTRGRTTDVSRKYLLCAGEGRFADVLRQLVQAIFRQDLPEVRADNWTALLAAVAGVGSTSGADMLVGAAIGCQVLVELMHQ